MSDEGRSPGGRADYWRDVWEGSCSTTSLPDLWAPTDEVFVELLAGPPDQLRALLAAVDPAELDGWFVLGPDWAVGGDSTDDDTSQAPGPNSMRLRELLGGDFVHVPTGQAIAPPIHLRYEVTGSGSALVTYISSGFNQQQETVTLPWQYEPTTGSPSVVAQLNGTGSITCRITRGAELLSQATSSGLYAVVSCV